MAASDMKDWNLNQLPCGVLATDKEGRIIEGNRHMAELLGLQLDGLASLNIWDFSTAATRIFMQTHIWPTLHQEGLIREVHIKLLHQQGYELPVLLNAHRSPEDGTNCYIWVFLASNDRNKLEKELLQARQLAEQKTTELAFYAQELERSNNALSDFANLASHDLKAPLRGISLLAHWIEEDVKPSINDEARENFNLLKNRITRLENLLDDLLAFSKAGRNHGAFKPIDLEAFTRDIFELLSPPSGIKLTFEGKLPTITTLDVPLDIILRNIMDNAIKHHDTHKGKIVLSCENRENHYLLNIVDDGPGIAPEDHAKIFDMFHTLKSREEVEGSGMGLAMVKKLVETYRAKIEVTSNGRSGTGFLLTWPKESQLRSIVGSEQRPDAGTSGYIRHISGTP